MMLSKHFIIVIHTEQLCPIFPISDEIMREVREQRGQFQ